MSSHWKQAGSADAGAAATLSDPVGAFCAHGPRFIEGRNDGPLAGLRFAVKDLFDVAGFVTGCGNPNWLRTHAAAGVTAPTVQRLLDAGADLVGKTHTDELAYSLNGENAHYGTPINSRAPDRIPGGSSSGSAAAVAAGLVDFALATDTGGSVRVPASYCGIFGLRPTHGRLSVAGCMPLAPSFDTVGWFADRSDLLARVGTVLLESPAVLVNGRRTLIATTAFECAESDVRDLVNDEAKRLLPMFAASDAIEITSDLETWGGAYRILQGHEVWRIHGDWIKANLDSIGSSIRERLMWTSTIGDHELAAAARCRREAQARLRTIFERGDVLLMPTTPCTALPKDMPADQLASVRARLLGLNSIAGLCGLPQLNIPIRPQGKAPVGLSLIGPPGSDEELLGIAQHFCA